MISKKHNDIKSVRTTLRTTLMPPPVVLALLLSMSVLFAPLNSIISSLSPISTVYATESTAPAIQSSKLILNSPVIDKAHILSHAEEQQISLMLRQLYQDGLAQAAVIIVPTTDGVPVFDYAMAAADRWQLGDKDTDTGLLMVVAVNDRKMHIVTGYGLEGVLPDAVVSRVIRSDITPMFKRNDYGGGILAGVSALSNRLYKDSGLTPHHTDGSHEATNSSADNKSAYDAVIGNTEPFGLFVAALFFGSMITSIFGRFFGSSLVAGGFFVIAGAAGMGIVLRAVLALFLWLYLLGMNEGINSGMGGKKRASRRGGRRRSGRRIVRRSSGGGFGSGGSGGFGGGGGFSGGGGGFGGGGAGGSW